MRQVGVLRHEAIRGERTAMTTQDSKRRRFWLFAAVLAAVVGLFVECHGLCSCS
jgi:hypothetical protein